MIDVPDRMKHLDRDHRGYPIPFIVFRDTDGKPHKIFVGVMAIGQFYTDRGYVVPKKPFRCMEFWRDGKMEQRFEREVIAAAMQQAAIAFQKAGML